MAPNSNSISSNATLHALTERLASHSRSLHPLINSNFAATLRNAPFTAQAYRQPAPPPLLPVVQLVGRHQYLPTEAEEKAGAAPPCPTKKGYPRRGEHSEVKCARCTEAELDGFIDDLALVLRREYDYWVEQCWTEAFHHLFTKTLPTLMIQLILTGASPAFLRKQIVHGGPGIDALFQAQMLEVLYSELELRLSGARSSSDAGSSKVAPAPHNAGVCFHNLAWMHGMPAEEDDHALCLCQLTSCLECFRRYARCRRGPIGLLPFELAGSAVREGWSGLVETEEQARARRDGGTSTATAKQPIPQGRGFVRNAKPAETVPRPTPMFAHPQMTDVLAVEEHLRWRLKEMGASDPAVEGRYGPCTNDPAALEGVELPDDAGSEDGSVDAPSVPGGGTGGGPKNGQQRKMVKVAKGRGKRRPNGAVVRKGDKGGGKTCYLPKEWTDEDPPARNMAIVLTFRHFVQLLHSIASTSSPFAYASYLKDVEELRRVHPIGLYRRLAEPCVARRKVPSELSAWQDCMDKWGEELGAREKSLGNTNVSSGNHPQAIEHYTRAISLDGKKTVYYSNRAVALNYLGQHDRAEMDCKYILARDGKNSKAFYQRGLARKGLGRWREAEADVREALKYQPGNESAKRLMADIKAEVAKLPKQTARDVMDF